ncbi:MAG: AMP-binding protein [Pirellulales bacterium]
MPGQLTVDQLVAEGLEPAEAESFAARAIRAARQSPEVAWREISRQILKPEHPFELHKFLFEWTYRDWDESRGPAPAWTPTEEDIRVSNVGLMMRERGFTSVAELHAWSVRERAEFWAEMIDRLGIRFDKPYAKLLDLSGGVERAAWLTGAKLNIAESCFQADPGKPAVVYHDERGAFESLSYRELNGLVNRAANGIREAGFRAGDALAIYLPMNVQAVTIYLAIIRAGCVAVSIADSLVPQEIATRLRLANSAGIFTQDVALRGGKPLALFAKIVEAGAPRAVVIKTDESTQLRTGDVTWDDFLSDNEQFEPYIADPDEPTNILFSSGTTGEPKAIPFDHVTPIRCAVDSYLHQDVHSDDRLAWPTNLGWVMGPWLIYSSLMHRATMCLFGGAPTGRDFGRFVQDARVTMLGVIPSLVKTWRATGCMRSLDWSRVRRFTSTGECSSADDMLHLASLAGHKPVIEYCGGTELGGGYIGGTMAQPSVLAAFSTPSFGIDLVMVRDESSQTEAGEIFLVPPALGMSTRLLHHDHHAVYFEDTPRGPAGETLRRHGDAMERLPGGYYRAQGRVDDTMNLGGIKTSAVEIERVLSGVAEVSDTAAIAVTPPGGGPSMLWVFAVVRPECAAGEAALCRKLQAAIRCDLNPLFKIERLVTVDELPRTASNKIMRRVLRDSAVRMLQEHSAPAE